MDEQKLTGIIHRALVSRGHQRIADLREALSLAVEISGAETRDTPATNNLATSANLRDMLNNDGIKGNAKALASIVRAIRQFQ